MPHERGHRIHNDKLHVLFDDDLNCLSRSETVKAQLYARMGENKNTKGEERWNGGGGGRGNFARMDDSIREEKDADLLKLAQGLRKLRSRLDSVDNTALCYLVPSLHREVGKEYLGHF